MSKKQTFVSSYNAKSQRLVVLEESLISFGLSVMTVLIQAYKLPGSFEYIAKDQFFRHNAVLEGTAGNPWVYRVGSEYLLFLWHKFISVFNLDFVAASISFRIIQNFVIFMLISKFISIYVTRDSKYLAMLLFAYITLNSNWNSDLSFNIYTELIVCLSFAILYHEKKILGCYLVVFLGVLNRETSIYLAIFMFSFMNKPVKRDYTFAFKLLFLGLATYLSIRMIIGPRAYMRYECCSVPLGYLKRNFESQSIFFFSQTMFALILVIIVCWKSIIPRYKRGIILTIPWILIHFCATFVEETRLFLVPTILIYLPAVLGLGRSQLNEK